MWTVGQVARRFGLRVSAVHFYERRGLLPPVPRVGGQRRYGQEHLRRLAFLQLCQDASLTLEEIETLSGADADVWRDTVRRRIATIDAELTRLRRARRYLAGSLRCPADHPAADCPYLGAEIDRRLAAAEPSPRGH